MTQSTTPTSSRAILQRLMVAATPLLCLIAAGGLLGCSELLGEEQPLDCQWLASNNCWKQALAEASTCVPSGTGSFDASRQVCSYGGGESINFSSAVSFDTNNQWSYTVSEGGGNCLTFRELGGSGRSFELTTNLGDVLVEEAGLSLSVSCPDGSSYVTADTSMQPPGLDCCMVWQGQAIFWR